MLHIKLNKPKGILLFFNEHNQLLKISMNSYRKLCQLMKQKWIFSNCYYTTLPQHLKWKKNKIEVTTHLSSLFPPPFSTLLSPYSFLLHVSMILSPPSSLFLSSVLSPPSSIINRRETVQFRHEGFSLRICRTLISFQTNLDINVSNLGQCGYF